MIEAFRAEEALDAESCGPILALAQRLARHHQEQWAAEDRCHDRWADDRVVASLKRAIDAMNANRVEMVEQIDAWVTQRVVSPQHAPLHTETFGSVIDRLAVAWVRARNLAGGRDPADPTARDRGRRAAHQLAELATAYDGLVGELRSGRRRVPGWYALQSYGAAEE